ncbi:hypothetical protein PF003_g40467 [Phytophthora fragariae]|nr:hypothetical protein PF003_g40467 [Phytophthora fragariae]
MAGEGVEIHPYERMKQAILVRSAAQYVIAKCGISFKYNARIMIEIV